MTDLVQQFERIVLAVVWAGVVLASGMSVAVLIQRVALYWHGVFVRRIGLRYGPLVQRALAADSQALAAVAESPSRYRLTIAKLVIDPLINNRAPARISAARRVVQTLSLRPLAERYLASLWWWRRVLALQGIGLIQQTAGTAHLIAALDDPHPVVRNAALDALADLQDPAALPAIVVRLHDGSLHRSRRLAALQAFGSQCEPLLLDLARIDLEHRVNYALALAICGTDRSRSTLCEWTTDSRCEVRAASFRALARVGLDDQAASQALAALESPDADERSMAAASLRGWSGSGDAPAHLARHLGDSWNVAVRAARTLQSMGDAGRHELEACARRDDLAGTLARQVLWETDAQR
jgi:HEAT repeat protein